MAFGADTNAHTSFSETVYELDLPTSDEQTLRDGMTVLADFGFGMLIPDEEVEAEKGVIDGEQRERDSAFYRIGRRTMERLFDGTLYASNTIIGEPDVRAAFTGNAMRHFYRKWYRPDTMTLVIIGDLGALDPVALIEEAFAGEASPPSAIPEEPAVGSASMENRFFVIHEPEVASTSISVSLLRPWEDEPYSRETIVEDIDLSMAWRILALRFLELTRDPDTPFLSASVGPGGGLEVFEGASLSVRTEPDVWRESLAAAEAELRRALTFGFQQAELDEVRADYLRSLDEAVERMRTRSSASILREVLSACEDRFVPTDALTWRDMVRPAVESLTLSQVHAALVEDWSEGELSIVSTGNLDLGPRGGMKLLTAFIKAGLDSVEAAKEIELQPFAYASDAAVTGEVVTRQHVEDLDVWLVEFANGVQLNIKVTDFRERQIIVRARLAEGGLTLPPEQYALSFPSDAVLNGGGLGAHSDDDLRRLTAGRQVGIGISVEEDVFTLAGSTAAEDLLLQLELLCAYMQDPGWREDGLVQLHQRLPPTYEQLTTLTEGPFLMDFLPALHSGDPRFVAFPPLAAVLDVTVDDVRAWIEPHLGSGPLEVTIVGDLDVEAVVAAAARSLGTLPARRERRAYTERRRGPVMVEGMQMERAVPTEVPKSLVVVTFPTDDGFDAVRRRELGFLGQVVNDRLRLEVRERLGAAYSPSASSQASEVFEGVGMVAIRANADPGQVQVLVDACLDVARNLAEQGVTEEEVARLAEPVLNQIRDARRRNGFWASQLGDAQTDPAALDDIRSIDAFFENIDAGRLSVLASEYLQPSRANVLIVNPEVPAQ